MLGRHHVSISLATVLPFLVPLIFVNIPNGVPLGALFLFCVFVGSLVPDIDSNGKPKLYYDLKIVYKVLYPLFKVVVWIFNTFNFKAKLDLQYDVKEEHRGIMHSPIGIVISTIFLTIIISGLLFWIKFPGALIIILFVFFGILIGQFLHLLEDSCTVSGINWKFPFKKRLVNGQIRTFDRFEEKKDIRPFVFQFLLGLISVVEVIYFLFSKTKISILIVWIIALLLVAGFWWIIWKLAQSNNELWYWEKEKIKQIKTEKKAFDRLFK